MTSRPSKLLSIPLLFLLSVSNSFGLSFSMMEVMKLFHKGPIQGWMEQKLDHFNVSSKMTWYQRYFENLQFYETEGPVFIAIGGESSISKFSLGGNMIQLARKLNAATFILEHRYYGMSIPVITIEKKTYQYLSSKQALADLVAFIGHIKRVHPELKKAKVIVFGGSYAGNLAAWMRLKYPELVYGAVASSAPVQAQVDFPECMETAGESFRRSSPQCEAAIRNATAELKNIMNTSDRVKFLQMPQLDIWTMPSQYIFNEIAQRFANVVQNYYEQIREVCNNMTNGNLPPVQRYMNVYRHLISQQTAEEVAHTTMNKRFISNDKELYKRTEESFGPLCKAAIETATIAIKDIKMKINNVKDIQDISQLQLLRLSSKNGFMSRAKMIGDVIEEQFQKIPKECKKMMQDYAWRYQVCNEFGYMQTYSEKQPFGEGPNLEELIPGYCYKYGINNASLQSNVKRTNDYYGGRHPNVTRVVFVNGDLDPWHKLGITTDLNPESPAIVIEGTSHCTDMDGETDIDPESLINARNRIEQEVTKWVGGYHMNTNGIYQNIWGRLK